MVGKCETERVPELMAPPRCRLTQGPWRDGVRIKSARETRAPDVFITHSGSVKLRRTVKTRKYSSLAFSHSKALREGSLREGSIREVGVREGSVREGTGWEKLT